VPRTVLFVLLVAMAAAIPLTFGQHSARRNQEALERQVAKAQATAMAADAAVIRADRDVARQRAADEHLFRQAAP